MAAISKCHVLEGQPFKVQTEGVNFAGVCDHQDMVDVNAVHTNDIGVVLDVLGVEAARAVLVKECSAVFGVYGIAVDPRHLSLIADHMTHQVCKHVHGAHMVFEATGPGFKADVHVASMLHLGRAIDLDS